MKGPEPKALLWMGSSLKDLKEFPVPVQKSMGHALNVAQGGGKHPDAKPLRGFHGAGVLEVVEDFDGDSFRTVYTVRFEDAVCVLHAFQKKSKRGIETPKHELELIRARYEAARQLHSERVTARGGGR